ncbi:MAG: hypothetical protein P4L22_06885 [Candidatus Babeliales bacterium]|nr:hypothetical protein [Candidatus Babeliales bacterium]
MTLFSKIILGALVIILLLCVYIIITAYFFPFQFPKPTGQFCVRSEIHEVKNNSMLDELKIQLWYPETLRNTYPVILYSFGSGGSLVDNRSLCEELASKGYIVVGIGHNNEAMGKIKEDFYKTKNIKNIEYKEKRELTNLKLEYRVAEAQSVLDYLEVLNVPTSNNKFFGKLDLQKIGYVGHSFGGSIAVEVCRRDIRCKATIIIDGPCIGKNATVPFQKPIMYMVGEYEKWMRSLPDKDMIKYAGTKEIFQEGLKDFMPAFNTLANAIGKDVHKIKINGAGHMSFTNFAITQYASPWQKFKTKNLFPSSASGVGNIHGYRAHEIMNAYVCAFFDRYLKSEKVELLDEHKSKYHEVEIQKW